MAAPHAEGGTELASPLTSGPPARNAWAEDEPPPIVRTRGVSHHFGYGESRKQVLFDNSLEFFPGEIVIMTGPSGSGKTTLLTLIGALRSVQAGSVQVLGEELNGLPPRRLVDIRRRIGFIFQAHNLFDALTAAQNVRLGQELHGGTHAEKRERATEMLTALGLEHRLHYKPHALSGGQRQRVAIARALVNRPQLILADEPTAALDKDSGRDVVTLFQKLAQEEQRTILIVTHDNRMLDVADRIVNMVDGRIISNVAVKATVMICEFLAQCSAFMTLPPSALSGVAQRLSKERFLAGTIVYDQGDHGDKFYLVRQGSCDVIVQDEAATRVVRTIQAGESFGEMALLTEKTRTATIRTRENTVLYSLGKEDFRAVIDASPTLKDQLLNAFFQRQ